MDRRVKSKCESSLCEKSMMVVANVIRLSSFSIAQKTLGVTTTGKDGKELSGSDYSDVESEKEPLVPHQFPKEPLRGSNPTYVKPVGSSGSNRCVIYGDRVHKVKPKKEECVDGLASDYITKIRNKLGCGT